MGGLRTRVLGARLPIQAGETFILVADKLIVKFRAKGDIANKLEKGEMEKWHPIREGDTLEVSLGRPLTLKAVMPIERVGKLLQGAAAVFDHDIIPLLDLYCPCCH